MSSEEEDPLLQNSFRDARALSQEDSSDEELRQLRLRRKPGKSSLGTTTPTRLWTDVPGNAGATQADSAHKNTPTVQPGSAHKNADAFDRLLRLDSTEKEDDALSVPTSISHSVVSSWQFSGLFGDRNNKSRDGSRLSQELGTARSLGKRNLQRPTKGNSASSLASADDDAKASARQASVSFSSLPSIILAGLLGVFFMISMLISGIFRLINLPLPMLVSPIVAFFLFCLVIVRPVLLASFLGAIVNLGLRGTSSRSFRAEIGRLDLLHRSVENIIIYFDDVVIFDLRAVSLRFNSSLVPSLHGSTRPLLTLLIKGVEINLLHSFVLELLKKSNNGKEKEHQDEDKKHGKFLKMVTRLLWMSGFLIVEVDKVDFVFVSGECSFHAAIDGSLLSMEKKDFSSTKGRESVSPSRIGKGLSGELRLSFECIDVNVSVPYLRKTPVWYCTGFAFSAGFSVPATIQLGVDTRNLCTCKKGRNSIRKVQRLSLVHTSVSMEYMDSFISFALLAVVRSLQGYETSGMPENDSAYSEAADLAGLSAAKRIELSKKGIDQLPAGALSNLMKEKRARGESEVSDATSEGFISDFSQDSAGWECPECSFFNPTSESKCSVCKTKPSKKDKKTASKVPDVCHHDEGSLEENEEEMNSDDVKFDRPSEGSEAGGDMVGSELESTIIGFLTALPRKVSFEIADMSCAMQSERADTVTGGYVLLRGNARFLVEICFAEDEDGAITSSMISDIETSNCSIALLPASLDKALANHFALRDREGTIVSEDLKDHSLLSCTSFSTKVAFESDVSKGKMEKPSPRRSSIDSEDPLDEDGEEDKEDDGSQKPRKDWECANCSRVNDSSDLFCSLCNASFSLKRSIWELNLTPSTLQEALQEHHHESTLDLNVKLKEPSIQLDASITECASRLQGLYQNAIDEERDEEFRPNVVDGKSKHSSPSAAGKSRSAGSSSTSNEQEESMIAIHKRSPWVREVVGVSLARSLRLSIDIGQGSARLVPAKPIDSKVFRSGSHHAAGAVVALESFLLIAKTDHGTPAASTNALSWAWAQRLLSSSSATLGNVVVSQPIPRHEARGKIQLLGSLERRSSPFADDQMLSKVKFVQLTGPFSIQLKFFMNKDEGSVPRFSLSVLSEKGLKLHLYPGIILRLIATLIRFKVEHDRYFRSESFDSGKRHDESTRSSSTTLSGMGDVRLRVSVLVKKLQINIHAVQGLGAIRHVFRLQLNEIKVDRGRESPLKVKLKQVNLAQSTHASLGHSITFHTILRNDILELGLVEKEQSSSETFIICIFLKARALQITQSHAIEFGDGLQALLLQRKAFREGLNAIWNSLPGVAPGKESSGHPASRRSTKGGSTGRTVRELELEVSIETCVVRFLQQKSSFHEDPKVHSFAPSSPTPLSSPSSSEEVEIVAFIAIKGVSFVMSWNSVSHSRVALVDRMWELDDCTSDRATKAFDHGFSFVIGFDITNLVVSHLVMQLRNHSRPLVEAWEVSLTEPAELVFSELRGTSACTSSVSLVVCEPFPFRASAEPLHGWTGDALVNGHPFGAILDGITRASVPLKLHYFINLQSGQLSVAHGDCLSATINAFDTALSRAIPKSSDTRSPKLGFWDKLRYMYHGILSVSTRRASIRLLTLSPWHGDTGVLVTGNNVRIRNLRERNLERGSRKRRPGLGQKRRRTQPGYSSEVLVRDVMDWGSFFVPMTSTSRNMRTTSHRNVVGVENEYGENVLAPQRDWELTCSKLSLSCIRDLEDDSVEQHLLLTVPRTRLQLSFAWGLKTTADHYVQLHHHAARQVSEVADMYSHFRSRGLSLGIKFELGCSLSEAIDQGTVTKGESVESPSEAEADESDEDEEMEFCSFPTLALCWEAYPHICDVLRSFSPPGPPKTALDKATFGRLLTHLKIGVLADRPRVMWWEEPESEACLFSQAESLVTRIEYVRERSEKTQWEPPYGLPPKWKQHALLVQCPEVAGHFLPRALDFAPRELSAVLFESRTYVDATGCSWRCLSVFPAPVMQFEDYGQTKASAEPFIQSPAIMLTAGKWRQLQASLRDNNGPEMMFPDDDEAFTIVMDEIRLKWTIKIRDAVFMVVGSSLFAIRQQWKIDERLHEQAREENLMRARGADDYHDDGDDESDFADANDGNLETLENENTIDEEVKRGDSDTKEVNDITLAENQRREQFDGHFFGPLVDFEEAYAPEVSCNIFMADLLRKSAMDVSGSGKGRTRVAHSEDYGLRDEAEENEQAENLEESFDEEFAFSALDDTAEEPTDEEGDIGELAFLVKVRWAQVHLRSGNDSAFVTGDLAIIKTFKNLMKCFNRFSESEMTGFNMLRKEVDVKVEKAQVFTLPTDADDPTGPTKWVNVRREYQEYCFSDTLEDWDFYFHEDVSQDNLAPHEGVPRVSLERSLSGHRRNYNIMDGSPNASMSHKPALTPMSFTIRELTFAIIPPNDEVMLARWKPEDAKVPLGKFLVDLPDLKIQIDSSAFFNILGVIRKILLVMPSPDHTALMTTTKLEAIPGVRASPDHENWIRVAHAGGVDHMMSNLDVEFEDSYESGTESADSSSRIDTRTGSKFLEREIKANHNRSQSLEVVSSFAEELRHERASEMADEGEASALEDDVDRKSQVSNASSPSGQAKIDMPKRSTSPLKRAHTFRTISRIRQRSRTVSTDLSSAHTKQELIAASALAEARPPVASTLLRTNSRSWMNDLEAELRRSNNDVKVLKHIVEKVLTRRPASSLGRRSELVYSIGMASITLLEENETEESFNTQSRGGKFERVYVTIAGLRGSHLFNDDGSTKVQMSLMDIKVTDCVQIGDQYRDILRGFVLKEGSSNVAAEVPVLRVDASTKSHILLGDYKVNVYDILQILIYPGARYRLALHLTWDTAQFLMRFFKSEADGTDGDLMLAPHASELLMNDQNESTAQPVVREREDSKVEKSESSFRASYSKLRAGFILKRGRDDLSWSTGKVRRNFALIRVVKDEEGEPLVVLEYYRNHHEPRLFIGPRGVLPLREIKALGFTNDETAPQHAIDLTTVLPTGREVTYTFAPDLSARREANVEPRQASAEWVATMVPFLEEERDVLDESLRAYIEKDSKMSVRAILKEISEKARKQFVALSSSSFKASPQNSNAGDGSMKEPLHLTSKMRAVLDPVELKDPEEYLAFLQKLDKERYLLSTRRASAMGLLDPETARMQSGELTDLVYIQSFRASALSLSFSCQGFPYFGNLKNKTLQCKPIKFELRLSSWPHLTRYLKLKIYQGAVRSALTIGRDKNRNLIREAQQQEEDRKKALLQQQTGK